MKQSRHPDEAIRLIELRGATVTAARVQVLSMLLAAESAQSHHALMELAAAGRPLDRVTLYRVLDWLVAQQLAHSITGQDRVRRFSVAHAHDGHAHFECGRCGRLFCLPEAAVLPATPPGFHARSVELTVHGQCADCARAA